MFVVVGIASGLALGLYLAETRDMHAGNAGFYADGPSISVTPTKTAFETGEQVTLRITNTGAVPLHSGDGTYGATVTGLSGVAIYAFTIHDTAVPEGENKTGAGTIITGGSMHQEEEEEEGHTNEAGTIAPGTPQPQAVGRQGPVTTQVIPPGGWITISWDQTKQDGEPVQPGLYKVNVRAESIAAVAEGGGSLAPATAAGGPPAAAAETVVVEDSVAITIR